MQVRDGRVRTDPLLRALGETPLDVVRFGTSDAFGDDSWG